MTINFSEVPGFPNIFLDYLYEFDNVQKYYKKNFKNEKDIENTIKNKSIPNETREILYQYLKSEYFGKEISLLTKNNIEAIKRDNTLAIVTGQQLGIFGGPLYTIYKIITAIKLSDEYNQKYPNYNFVPIFWLEGEDHDFEEVRKIKILDKENNLVEIQYNDELSEETNRGPMGNYEFDENLLTTLDFLKELLRETEFKTQLLELIDSFYKVNDSFKSSFKKLLIHFFDKYGLLIFDPQKPEMKKLMQPIFEKDIENYKFISEELIGRSAELDELYHAQVKIKPVNLFLLEDEGRYLIEPIGNEFRLKGKRKKFTKDELLTLLKTNPEKFSPNVILRPICQDYILPTAVYVAGPGEISYFAQIVPYYDILNIEIPIFYPRVSATIIESKVQNILSRYKLDLQNFFYESENLVKKVIENITDIQTSEVFNTSIINIEKTLSELQIHIKELDPSLGDTVNQTKDKILHYLTLLKEKTLNAASKKNEIVNRQISNTISILFPDDNLQEREINFIYFMNKYGLSFVDFVYEKFDIDKFDHQIIQL